MKFAFLTSSYYSNEDANGICVKNIVDVLKKEGHIIYILSEGNEKEKSVDGLRCFFVKETVLKKIKNFYQDNRSVVSLILYKIVSIIRKIFLGITSPLPGSI